MRKRFQVGDILGFSGRCLSSVGINLATYGVPYWDLSHVAIVGEYRGREVLFESTTLCDLPCMIRGKLCDGVQAHPIRQRIADYNGKVWHYPLHRTLYVHERARLARFLLSHLGAPYDLAGAERAGLVVWSAVWSWLRPTHLSSFFCSELCAAAHATAGLFPTGHAARWSPNKFCRAERRAGILCQPVRLK